MVILQIFFLKKKKNKLSSEYEWIRSASVSHEATGGWEGEKEGERVASHVSVDAVGQTSQQTVLAVTTDSPEPCQGSPLTYLCLVLSFSRQKREELAQRVAEERTRREEEARQLEAQQAREREEQLRRQEEGRVRREREEMERIQKQVGGGGGPGPAREAGRCSPGSRWGKGQPR